uniref:C-C motif chemokine n=1 Tax=Pelusios castaneus TaxID=367368 RepID=A0A8C8RG23_9SAUR
MTLHILLLLALPVSIILTIHPLPASHRWPSACPPGSENQASDCCLGHKNQLIPLHVLASYRRQGPETGCRLPAVVFITKKNKSLCAPPTAQWALDLMQKLDKKKPKMFVHRLQTRTLINEALSDTSL